MNLRWTGLPLCLILLAAGCQLPPTTPQTAVVETWLPPPHMTTEILGHSVEGRPIVLHRFGDGPVATLVIGGFHGDEPTGITLAQKLIELLQTGNVQLDTHSVAIIPVANPDGYAKGKRANARRVDINRNFPAKNWATTRPGTYHGGKAPLSEPETVILKNAVESLHPRQIISIHSIGRGRECDNYDGPGEELAKRMSLYNGYPVRDNIGYPTPGSFGSWAGIDRQIAVITLELPRELPGEQAWQDNREALIAALKP